MSPLADILIALRFFSRLPVPTTRREIALGAGGLAAAAAMVPLAGLVIGLVPAVVVVAAGALALPPTVNAALAVAGAVLVTGALHEDALADCADGFGGGGTRERKLEIMRDSRIGTFGACAVGLSLIVRVAAIAAIVARDVPLAAAMIVATAALSRTACLAPLYLLAPARSDGSGVAAARIVPLAFALAVALAAGLALLPMAAGATLARCGVAMALAALAALAMTWLAARQIGGQTGDVAGATQQLAEIAALVTYAAGL